MSNDDNKVIGYGIFEHATTGAEHSAGDLFVGEWTQADQIAHNIEGSNAFWRDRADCEQALAATQAASESDDENILPKSACAQANNVRHSVDKV